MIPMRGNGHFKKWPGGEEEEEERFRTLLNIWLKCREREKSKKNEKANKEEAKRTKRRREKYRGKSIILLC